ncbi:FAD-dependent oxidoreductase [Thermodesulfobacteriota bacterium]
MNHTEIGILGAGIMGCCLALDLAQRGYRVDLIDCAPEPMTGASLHNEGKLHLGFVYANDPLKATHGLMLRGSLAFSRIIERLTGCGADFLKPSQPFHYFVPVDSQLELATIDDHFHEVQEAIHEETRRTGDIYLGRKIDRYHKRNSSRFHERLFSSNLTLGSFMTEERSISPVAVSLILRRAIKNQPNLNFLGNTHIISADRLASGDVEIETRREDNTVLYRYSSIANCLWDDRIRIDRTAGIFHDTSWLFRYKVTINVRVPAREHNSIPSATGILGPYGDVVNYNDGSYYISWYPLCKIVQSNQEDGRILHDKVHKGLLPKSIRKMTSRFPPISKFVASISHRKFVKDNIREMTAYIPAMTNLLNNNIRGKIGGGIIVAKGHTDIDDPESLLHQRSAIGPIAYGTYVTVDTGKFCTAPLFAQEAADMIVDILK